MRWPLFLAFFVLFACSGDDSEEVDCSLIDCPIGFKDITFQLTENNEPVAIGEELSVTNRQGIEAYVREQSEFLFELQVANFDTLLVVFGDFEIEMFGSFVETGAGICGCGAFEFQSLTIGEAITCEDEACDEIQEIAIN